MGWTLYVSKNLYKSSDKLGFKCLSCQSLFLMTFHQQWVPTFKLEVSILSDLQLFSRFVIVLCLSIWNQLPILFNLHLKGISNYSLLSLLSLSPYCSPYQPPSQYIFCTTARLIFLMPIFKYIIYLPATFNELLPCGRLLTDPLLAIQSFSQSGSCLPL